MDSKIIALGAVVVIVAAAIGGGVYMMNNRDGGSDKVDIDAPTLLVYGNANGDYYLNDSDVSKLKQLVKDQPEDWAKTNPFADTDCNGSLTDDDVTMLEKILEADKDHPMAINVCSYALEVPYVTSVRYPVLKAASNTNQTSMATFMTLGIDSEIVATSVAAANTATDGSVIKTAYDRIIFGNFFDVMDSKHQIGAKSAEVAAGTLADVIKNTGCTVYIYSASQAALSNYSTLSKQIDFVQISDGMSEVKDYGSAVLLLGFLFGTSDNNYVDRSVEVVEWFIDFEKELTNGLKNVENGTTKKVSAVASSMSGYVSIKGSSNTNIIEKAGVYCPVASKNPTDASKSTMTYTPSDTWLNMIDMDSLVVLKGSSGGWSWFDGKYASTDLPSAMKSHVNNFSTLECYKNGKVIVVSTMMCGPQKSGAIAQYYYGDDMGENWFNNKMTDFYTKFWGYTAEDCAKFKYVLTQAEVLGTS